MNTILLMILGHMLADYTLQGWLAQAKGKSWWRQNFYIYLSYFVSGSFFLLFDMNYQKSCRYLVYLIGP